MTHPLLDKIAAESPRKTKTVEAGGHLYELASLMPEADHWAAENIQAAPSYTGYAVASANARLACALAAIDGTPVEALWALPSEPAMAYLHQDAVRAQTWRRKQILQWLLTGPSNAVLTPLHRALTELDNEVFTAVQGVGNLSTGTPSSD